MPINDNASENAIRCSGIITIKGVKEKCNRIIAEVEYAKDVKMFIKCPKCGTLNIIHEKPDQEKFVYNTPYQNRIPGFTKK